MNNQNNIFLVQTDTTAGFASRCPISLSFAKQRNPNQKILEVLNNFATLKNLTRAPSKFRKFIRNSKKTTFIYPNGNSFRIVDKNSKHIDFVNKFRHIYSTSANKTGSKFDFEYAHNCCDVIVGNEFFETQPSKIFKLSKRKIIKIRR